MNEVRNVETQVSTEEKKVYYIGFEHLYDIYVCLRDEVDISEEESLLESLFEEKVHDSDMYFTGLFYDDNPVYTDNYDRGVFFLLAMTTLTQHVLNESTNISAKWFKIKNHKYLSTQPLISKNHTEDAKYILKPLYDDFFRDEEETPDFSQSSFYDYAKSVMRDLEREVDRYFSYKTCLYKRERGENNVYYTGHGVIDPEIHKFLVEFIPFYRGKTGDNRHFIVVNCEGTSIRGIQSDTFNDNYINIVSAPLTRASLPSDTSVASQIVKPSLQEAVKVIAEKSFTSELVMKGIINVSMIQRSTAVRCIKSGAGYPYITYLGDSFNAYWVNVVARSSTSNSSIYIADTNDFVTMFKSMTTFSLYMKLILNHLLSDEEVYNDLRDAISTYVDNELFNMQTKNMQKQHENLVNEKATNYRRAALEYTRSIEMYQRQRAESSRSVKNIKRLSRQIDGVFEPHNFIRITKKAYLGFPESSQYHGGLVLLGTTRPYIFTNVVNNNDYLIPPYKISIPIPRTIAVNARDIEHPQSSVPFLLRIQDEFADFVKFLQYRHAERNSQTAANYTGSVYSRSIPPIFPHLAIANMAGLNITDTELSRFVIFSNLEFNDKPTAPVHTVCLGAKGVADYLKALRTSNIRLLINVISNFLVTGINMDDTWGSNIYNFPSLSPGTLSDEDYDAILTSLSFEPEFNGFWTEDIDRWKDYKYTIDDEGNSFFTFWDLTKETPELRTLLINNNPYIKEARK